MDFRVYRDIIMLHLYLPHNIKVIIRISFIRTKITIHETLRIFTKISMRDVDHYAEHYKKIFFMLKSVQDSSELIQKVDDEILLLK